MPQTHSLQIFGIIPFVKLQTLNSVTDKNDEKWDEKQNNLSFFGWVVVFLSVASQRGYPENLQIVCLCLK